MKMPTFLLFSALALGVFAEDDIANNEELAKREPVVMQRLAKVFGKSTPTERVAKLESQMADVYTDTVRGQFGAKAGSARPQIDSYRLYTAFDALLWKIYEGGDDYAFTDHVDSSSTPSVGANKHTTFGWDWGFRAILGYHFPHDRWDAQAKFTWFRDHASSRVGTPEGGATQPLTPAYESHNADLSSSKWKTKISILDIEIGRNYFLSSTFATMPFIGLRTAWIHQKMNQTFTDSPEGSTITYMKNRNEYWGIGPWTGLNTTWYFSSMFNMFGSIGGALMIADIDVRTRELQDSSEIIDLKADVTRVTPTLQAALGVTWEMVFNRSRNHVAVRFAYDTQYWWRQNQTLHFGLQGPAPFRRYSEDLGLHGVSLDLLFDF